MLDTRKIKIMTELALYEQTQGKQDFKISAYYRKDYSSFHMIATILWVTFGYICVVGLAAMGLLNMLMEDMSGGMLVFLIILAVVGYVVVVILYAIISSHIFNKKHKEARQRVKRYNHNLTKLLKLYERESEE